MSDNRSMQYAEILSKLIKVETISSRDNKDRTKFLEFNSRLPETVSSKLFSCSKSVNSHLLYRVIFLKIA